MDIQDRLSTVAGGMYAMVLYIKLIYGDWDMIIIGAANISIILSLIFGYRQQKLEASYEVLDDES